MNPYDRSRKRVLKQGDSPAAPAVPGHAILSLGQASPNDLVSRLGCL